MLTLITAVLGIIGTITAWYFQPKRKLYSELDQLYNSLEKLYERRDKALMANNSNELTICAKEIFALKIRKAMILKQLGG